MRTSDSTNKLIEALVAARPAFTPVRKDAVGQVGSDRQYRYADLAGLLEATMPALTAHGLAVLQAIDAETSTLITRVEHVSGEWVEAAYPLVISLQPQALGSSITYGRRYSLQSLLCLAADDDDAAAAESAPKRPTKATKAPKSEPITTAQRKRLFSIATAAGWSKEQIKAHLEQAYHVTSTSDLPASSYDDICADFERSPGGMPF